MDEEKGTKKAEETITAEGTGEGIQPKTNTLVDDTNLAAKRLEEATAAAREERLLAEESYAKRKLGGETEAGQTKPVEETPEEYAKKVMANEI